MVSSPQAPLLASLAGCWPLGLRISLGSVRIALVSSVSNRLAPESNRPAVSTFEAGLIALEDGLIIAAIHVLAKKGPVAWTQDCTNYLVMVLVFCTG